MWPLWRLALCLETCGELTETQEVSPVNSLKVLDVQNGWENQVPRGPALLHRSLLGVFPCIELTTSEISLIRLQTRFITLQYLKEINYVPLLCKIELAKDTWKLKELCKKIKIRTCKIIVECGKQALNLTCIKILKVNFKHACEM
jgi:hypothetical protein